MWFLRDKLEKRSRIQVILHLTKIVENNLQNNILNKVNLFQLIIRKNYKNHPNEPQLVPEYTEKKKGSWILFILQVVLIQHTLGELKNRSLKKLKYQFEGISDRSKHWFALDLEWLKTNFRKGSQNFISVCYKEKY